jgi:hypothetical protein
MTSVERIVGGRWPISLWLCLYCFVAVFFYMNLRWVVHLNSLTIPEQAFLFGYASACAFNFVWAIRFRGWIDAQLPQWLNGFWTRIALCFGICMVAGAIILALHVPDFYEQVLSKSALMFSLPYFLRKQQSIFLSSYIRTTPEDLPKADREVLLYMGMRKRLVLLLASLGFVGAGCFCLRINPVAAWLAIVFFGSGVFISLISFWPGRFCLRLNKEGFTMIHGWRELHFRWEEVQDFAVVEMTAGERVGWNFSEQYHDKKKRPWVKHMVGRDAFLVDDYGVPPGELCSIMEKRKEVAMGRRLS